MTATSHPSSGDTLLEKVKGLIGTWDAPMGRPVPSIDPTVLDFQFREATNLDTHPVHFHGTQWHLVDATHLVQDWFVMGGQKPVSLAHLEFTKRPEEAAPAE